MITQFFQKNNTHLWKKQKSLYYRKNSGKGSEKMSVLFLNTPNAAPAKGRRHGLWKTALPFDDRHIVEDNPTAEELKAWWEKSGLPLKKFFNTSGLVYKEQNLKERLPDMSEEEQLALLATNGMLVKRPLVIGEDFVLIGFKETEWERLK